MRQGKKLLDTDQLWLDSARQKCLDSFVKPRELVHDARLFRVYRGTRSLAQSASPT